VKGASANGLRPAVFIDRDGTLITERDYLADPDGVELVPGAAEALSRLRAAGYALVTVTNQSGIARGLYRESDYHAVADRVAKVLDEAGVPPDDVQYCPHHPEVTGPCDCRKPATGMYLRSAALLGLDPAASYYVGDKVTDVLPAIALGGRGILVRTGYGAEHEGGIPAEVRVADDLRAAADLILADAQRRS
jgi:D-glycero-D-manno-heptose 1,7-bisphosphate phosphatase